MAVPEEISHVFHNYKSELEGVEEKFGWFKKEGLSIYDVFEGRDLTLSLRSDIEIPFYLRQQIETIRGWYEEKKRYWENC